MKTIKLLGLALMIVMLGGGITKAQSNQVQQMAPTDILKNILRSQSLIGAPPPEDQIKKLLIESGRMSETNVIATLISWATNYPESQIGGYSPSAGGAIDVLGRFPSEATRRALLAIANGTNSYLRRIALRSLIRSGPGLDLDKSLEGVWFSSIAPSDYMSIYRTYIAKAECMTNQVENIQQFVDVMERLFDNHDSSSSHDFYLDRYLTKKIPGHRMRPSRQEWLHRAAESLDEKNRKYAQQELMQNDK